MSADLLIIHSDETSRRRLRAVAGRNRMELCETDSAVEGVLLAREARPRAVILEMSGHGMDSFVALQLIRAQVDDGAALLAVGLEDQELCDLAVELGATDALLDMRMDRVEEFVSRARDGEAEPRRAVIASLP